MLISKQKKRMKNTMKQKESRKILVDLKKTNMNNKTQPNTQQEKKLLSFLWKNKNYFPCKAMTICQAFRAECE